MPFSIATETHGSIIQPAAFCGAVGLRPSAGLVSLEGVMPLSATLDKVGPIALTPSDCLTILDAMAQVPLEPARVPDRPRIGVVSPVGWTHDAEVATNFEAALVTLREQADLEEVVLPELPFAQAYRAIVCFEAAENFAPLIADGTVDRLRSPLARGGSYLAEPQSAETYGQALELRNRLLHEWTDAVGRFDALVTTTNPKVAPPADAEFSAYFGDDDHEPVTTIGALLGLPAVTIPSGLGDRQLPTGLQFVGMPGNDAKICRLAEALSTAIGAPRPPAIEAGGPMGEPCHIATAEDMAIASTVGRK